jgi:hypothetical protein
MFVSAPDKVRPSGDSNFRQAKLQSVECRWWSSLDSGLRRRCAVCVVLCVTLCLALATGRMASIHDFSSFDSFPVGTSLRLRSYNFLCNKVQRRLQDLLSFISALHQLLPLLIQTKLSYDKSITFYVFHTVH